MSTSHPSHIEGPFAELFDALSTVKRPGDYYAQGALTAPIPRIDVDGLGTLSFPLQEFQAEKLIALAERAPYGRGSKTILDTTVRSTWQLSPERFQIQDTHWEKTLAQIVERAAADMGYPGSVSAELYKLLLYDRGSFFLEHRDSEKTEGMFGTLMVLLPSVFRGGELVVRHGGREVVLALKGEDLSQVFYAAFYADCIHELRPVTNGYRLCLIYNLVRRGKGAHLRAPDYGPELAKACRFLKRWSCELAVGHTPVMPTAAYPDKLLYLLEHHYTPAGLSFAGLKGADAAVAALLKEAAQRTDFAFHLAMVSIHESGSAEETYYRDRRRHRYLEDEENQDFEVIEIVERLQQVEHWIDANDSQTSLEPIPFEDDELCPPGALDHEKPDEQHYMEASGNEGASFERTYRRAALVLWPHHHFMAIIAQASRSVSLSFLRQLVEKAEQKPGVLPSRKQADAHTLARLLIDRWPAIPEGEELPHFYHDEDETEMLAALLDLKDAALLDRFLGQVVCAGRYAGGTNESICKSRSLLGWERTGALVVKLLRRSMRRAFQPCVELVASLLSSLDAESEGMKAARAIANAMIEGLPRATERFASIEASFVTTVFTVLWRIGDKGAAHAAVAHLREHPKVYPLDNVLLPATLALRERSEFTARSRPGLEQLETICLAALRERAAIPLIEPRDWSQNRTVSCACKDCQEAQAFLNDPNLKIWNLKAAKERRAHVQGSLSGTDLDFETVRSSNPHRLVCTKNRKSYERLCRQREQDLAAIATLNA
jgi:hypothetical protein